MAYIGKSPAATPTGIATTATGTVLTLTDTSVSSTQDIRLPTAKAIADDSGNEYLKFTKTASAVNEFTVVNSATGNAPEISATGSDTNIDLKITPKGTGKIILDGLAFPNADGSANQVLQTNGSGVLSFAGVSASAGQVIQVITATDDTQRSTSSTSFVTGSNTLSVSITPASTSNKIFIVANVNSGDGDSGGERHFTIQRGATNLGNTSGLAQGRTGAGTGFSLNVNMAVLDSPNTTSATTYQVYMRSPSGNTTTMNTNSCRGTITCFEIKG